ncbi:alpha/beta hydrolase [Microbacterium sp. CFBP9023]|uniref:alpha/beta hydrolase n=1 Tax=Microbacterium sp. CFBP9023 TaxID=3096535 RepID=UPI002A69D4BF|nr:alpha/beta hydrolase [Microbacterium sp. CFBP9023]MDY0982985.1 alpha/beta hydrolase [Microbacterium sp. CFBP9023]
MSNLTIVLVHGAFADAASFEPVTRGLLDLGHEVVVPAVPNRSLLGDSAYIRSVVEKIEGPVLLVGHSYGGAVITVAGAADNVVGLVYLSGYALEEGESLGQLQGGFPDSELAANLVYTPFPSPGAEDGTDVSVKVEAFPQVFAAGIDPAISEVLAVAQRPLAALAFSEAAPVAAWKTKPAFGIVSAADHTINPDVERFGYTRGNFRRVIELDAPHLVMRALPQDVIQFIVEAAAEVV